MRAALEHVHATLDGRPRLEEAAACAGISASRLTHLFSEEVGLPFRRYVLWARAKRALSEVRGGATLTRAAVASGFSDAAHLSRTFRRMFGLAPSSLFELADIDGDADE